MGKKRLKKKAWATKIITDKDILKEGVNTTVVFMKVISETKNRLKKNKELNHDRELELNTVLNVSRKILNEFFKQPDKKLSNIWDRVIPDYVDKRSAELYKKMTSRIILPGQTGMGGLILAKENINISKIRKEAEKR